MFYDEEKEKNGREGKGFEGNGGGELGARLVLAATTLNPLVPSIVIPQITDSRALFHSCVFELGEFSGKKLVPRLRGFQFNG